MSISLKQRITRNLLNFPGWKTNHKIVVIESDDWGSIRMASKEAYLYFLAQGYPVDQCPFNRYDALESNDDLELLFDILSGFKDKNDNPAIITANFVVSNPDFDRIKTEFFQNYYYESFIETCKRYPKHDRVYELYQEGLIKKIIKTQFHGREHLNVSRWMNNLQYGDGDTLNAFDNKMFTLHTQFKKNNKNEYMDALDFDTIEEKAERSNSIIDGLQLFSKLWGFSSSSFIAPSYIWDKKLEAVLNLNGVKYLQGMIVQLQPQLIKGPTYKTIYHYQGQKNHFGQRYLVRNAFFEPSLKINNDPVIDCLNRISIAFKWNKPAVISSHRVNYIGFLEESNRDNNLKLLKKLITEIIKRWPDVEFMTSDQLGDTMNNEN